MPEYMVLAPFQPFGASAGDIITLEEEQAAELDAQCKAQMGVPGL
jgi:hypothetical protein